MKMVPDIRQIPSARAILGEGIRYDAQSDKLTYLDIPTNRAWQIDPCGNGKELSLGPQAAFACCCEDSQFLAGGEAGLYLDGAPTGDHFLSPEEVLNDGAVHPSGEFLVFGSRDRIEEKPSGHMWCFGRSLIRLPWTFTVFNGPAFSPCGERVYFADSPKRTIYVAPVNAAQQRIGPREVFAEVPEPLGYPDGMICDEDGGLWSAHWDGGCLTRYRSDGTVDQRIEMPVSRPTSLAFRGSTLFITSAQEDGPGKGDRMDGHIFAFEAGHNGPPSPRFTSLPLTAISKPEGRTR